MSRIPPLCTKFDNAGVIIQYIIRINVHEYTCPAVRYLYPLQWLFEVCQSALSWTYYGSAAPFTNVDGENCLRVDDTTYEYICCGLGLGYLVLGAFAWPLSQLSFILHLCPLYMAFVLDVSPIYVNCVCIQSFSCRFFYFTYCCCAWEKVCSVAWLYVLYGPVQESVLCRDCCSTRCWAVRVS